MFTGELISLAVAFSWTATALFAEVASKRMGSLPLNVVRMTLSILLLMLTLWLTLGHPYPIMADGQTWLWLSLSGFVGYALGDYCLFQSYVLMGSRFGQLFMTLASPAAALTAWILLGEQMQPLAILGMIVTMMGIGMSVLNRGGSAEASQQRAASRRVQLKMPLRGVLFGIGAGMGQGIGLVLSKVGMQSYNASIAACGVTDMASWLNAEALFPVSLGFMMPFASTLIRAITGLVGFSVALWFFSRNANAKMKRALSDRRAVVCALGAAIFGPFVGVSLSLMATLYTSAGIAQTIMALTPVLILAPAWLLFHQRVTWLEVLGACISVVGVALFFV